MTAPQVDLMEFYGYGWTCGHCGELTTETHFYRDRADGTMHHAFTGREEAAQRCGWRFDDDYATVERCRLAHGHTGNHLGYHCHWSGDLSRPWLNGAIPPASEQQDFCAPAGGSTVPHGPEVAGS